MYELYVDSGSCFRKGGRYSDFTFFSLFEYSETDVEAVIGFYFESYKGIVFPRLGIGFFEHVFYTHRDIDVVPNNYILRKVSYN